MRSAGCSRCSDGKLTGTVKEQDRARWAARADFLRRLGRAEEARLACTEALLLTENAVQRAFLEGRLRGVGG